MRKEAKAEPDAATLKLALSALRKCARKDCNESFVKTRKNHRFCSPTCKATMWKREHPEAS